MWALVGSYASDTSPGGITAFQLDEGDGSLVRVGSGDRDLQAGYLVHAADTGTLYCVDERKTDGRGPVGAPAAVHAFAFDAKTGALSWKNSHIAPGPFPTFLDYDADRRLLVCANHGSFDHIEHIQRDDDGWTVKYLYDHSSVIVFKLDADGAISGISDLLVLDGHGLDPNSAKQMNGHAQASAHAHCATLDPSGRFLVVCDKGSDKVRVYLMDDTLKDAASFQFPPETAPRHVAFSADGTRMFLTLELASEVAAMNFDPATGVLSLIDRVPTTAAPVERGNEPAELRLHPDGRTLYVNNRGEDSLAWFRVADYGQLTRQGHVRVADSIHPGLAARNFTINPTGQFLLFADRPADCLRVFVLDPMNGAPTEIGQTPVSQPAFVALIAEEPST